MNLDLSKLERPRISGGKTIARCPACAETGNDSDSDHLFINSDGKFGCVLYQSSDGTEHRKRIFELVGIYEAKPITENSWTALPSAPTNAPAPTLNHYELGTPSASWTYHTNGGLIAGIVARFETPKGKETRPLAWCKDQHGNTGWKWKAQAEPRTIYGLPLDSDSVVIAEGEKTAEAIKAAGFQAVTWQGGSGAVTKSDWKPLSGKAVTIWPDNDEPGHKAANRLVSILSGIAAEIRIVKIPVEKPLRWDAADTDTAEIIKLISEAEVIEVIPADEKPKGDYDIPADVFPVPAGSISYTKAGGIIFKEMGKSRRLFMRGNSVHEIAKAEDADYLSPLSSERFCSIVENTEKRVARLEMKKVDGIETYVWRTVTFPISSAKILLETDAAFNHLPSIRQLVNCPIFTADCKILNRGYHDHAGGTYISSGKTIEDVPIGTAFQALRALLTDFDFPTPSDFSRAFASLISPAMKMGGWITDDFPLDLAEADQSQSGKTFRQKIVCRIYNELPSSITISKGGVGSLDEKISEALIKGRPFITLGNIRGKIDSTIMEEALRGSGRVNCRVLRNSAEVDCSPFLWQLSTNGAELTRDLANRSIVTRIRKRPNGYEWKHWPEGDLEAHVIRNQSFYLSCVFSLLREWHRQGRPVTKESRHDFRGWCRALDGIIQMVKLAPLLDGHREQQERTANPALQWLREIVLAAKREDHGRELYTHDLVNIAEDHGIEFPGNPFTKDESTIRAGRILGKIFKDAEADEITVDGFIFTRAESPDYTEIGKGRTIKKYTIQKP